MCVTNQAAERSMFLGLASGGTYQWMGPRYRCFHRACISTLTVASEDSNSGRLALPSFSHKLERYL